MTLHMHAMRAEMRETSHHSVSVGKRGLGTTDVSTVCDGDAPRPEGPQGGNFVHQYFGRWIFVGILGRIQSPPCGLAEKKKNTGSSYTKCLETNNSIFMATMLSIL